MSPGRPVITLRGKALRRGSHHPGTLRQQQGPSQFMEHAYTSAGAPDLTLGAASHFLPRPALGCDHSSFWNQTVHLQVRAVSSLHQLPQAPPHYLPDPWSTHRGLTLTCLVQDTDPALSNQRPLTMPSKGPTLLPEPFAASE